jgi:hypothetical protein
LVGEGERGWGVVVAKPNCPTAPLQRIIIHYGIWKDKMVN